MHVQSCALVARQGYTVVVMVAVACIILHCDDSNYLSSEFGSAFLAVCMFGLVRWATARAWLLLLVYC